MVKSRGSSDFSFPERCLSSLHSSFLCGWLHFPGGGFCKGQTVGGPHDWYLFMCYSLS